MPPGSLFVSSVQKELAVERRAIRDFVAGDALLSRFYRAFLFEDLPAKGRRADEVYLAEIDRAQVYVALLGDEYGSVDETGRSPTEREFDRATARGKPRFVFVKGQDDARRHPKMVAFVRKVGAQVIRRRFEGVAELTAAVYASLVDHLEQTGDIRTRPFDAAACLDATTEDVSAEKVRWFLDRARAERNFPLAVRTRTRDALAHLNLVDRGQPCSAAVLLFGRKPQRFLPASEVKCMHFHGTEVQKPIPSYQIYKGTLFEMVDHAVDFVLARLARSVGTRAQSTQVPVAYELPKEVVAEAIVNAAAHRDYASNASVQVMLFADRLEVWNPGELPQPLTPERLREPHPSIPHNPLVAESMFLAGYIEKAGSGTLDMIGRLRALGLPEPEFVQNGGFFVQRLRRPGGEKGRDGPESRPESRPESGPESVATWWRALPAWRAEWNKDSVHERVLLALQAGPLTRSQLASA
ncbi:MAG: DUF4062 domain-containing protein, partial [Planctomycetes bacterium]|nr:DUF4062 domain-containing protein [Planctomycetota bacterium]